MFKKSPKARSGSSLTMATSENGRKQSHSHGAARLPRKHRRMLANMGVYLESNARILDFGCGSGEATYAYRDAGFSAFGFDIVSDVSLRESSDTDFFRFASTGHSAQSAEFTIDSASYRIPFDDESFDFVFSHHVFEHVQDHDLVLREIARVLRRGASSIHVFPSRYALIEPHTFVPLGGAVRSFCWYRFWASMGIRNQFQEGLNARERACANLRYAKTGTKYLKSGEVQCIAEKYFAEVTFAPHLWEVGDQGILTTWGRLIQGWPLLRRFCWVLYTQCRQVVLYLKK